MSAAAELELLCIEQAARVVRGGGVIAYPTESCYGLGCDPRHAAAVRRIIRIKGRAVAKGVILIADHYRRFARYVAPPPAEALERALQTWPGPHTWLLPARPGVSRMLRGGHAAVAVRVTAHRPARELCRQSGMALISTSANRAGRPAIKTLSQLRRVFGRELDGVAAGRIGLATRPSTIIDALSGQVLRP